jgi:hypothetical protein
MNPGEAAPHTERKPNMKFKLEIELDNAAFDNDPMSEVQRLLLIAAARLELGETAWNGLRDVNGNLVGSYKTEE